MDEPGDSVPIGQVMRELRKKKGWSQTELGNAIGGGCDQTQVSKWESGKSYPGLPRIPRIAEVLETSVGLLLGLAPRVDSRQPVISEELCRRLLERAWTEDSDAASWILDEIQQAFIREGAEAEGLPDWFTGLSPIPPS